MSHEIRLIEEHEESEVFNVWYQAGKREYTYLQSWRTLDIKSAQKYFHSEVLNKNEVWVALNKGKIVAFLAMNGSYIDRLYVEPSSQRKGWGSKLIEFAKLQFTNGMMLHTHEKNEFGRKFYEKHGFVAVKFGISPPPESEPDVEYSWEP